MCNDIFEAMESYEEMSIHQLCHSKIGKVMRHIEQLKDIPCQEKFMFQERAGVLVEGWQRLVTTQIDYTKGSNFNGSGGMDTASPILYDMMRARKNSLGGVGGLNEVIVEYGSGRTISIVLPPS